MTHICIYTFALGFAIGTLLILTIDMQADTFPPRKPEVIIEGRECFIDGETLASSDAIMLSVEDL